MSWGTSVLGSSCWGQLLPKLLSVPALAPDGPLLSFVQLLNPCLALPSPAWLLGSSAKSPAPDQFGPVPAQPVASCARALPSPAHPASDPVGPWSSPVHQSMSSSTKSLGQGAQRPLEPASPRAASRGRRAWTLRDREPGRARSPRTPQTRGPADPPLWPRCGSHGPAPLGLGARLRGRRPWRGPCARQMRLCHLLASDPHCT
jgi:hypothetical protein